ncbi:hypothetical protein AB0B54_35665 [Microbispora bryophytorum]|uniref:hypothetical protein n=1 Tax=Microbispora bryophytorum TaxID=1460882 RepID=UPI0033F9822C
MDDLLAMSRRQLDGWASEFARKRVLPDETLRLRPSLHLDEANGLALARGAGLVEVQADGAFRLAGAAPNKGPYNLFSRGPAPLLNREYLVQIAAFAEIVIEHRWPARRVTFEYDALDLAVLDDRGRPLVVAETNRDTKSLEVMLAAIGSASLDQVTNPATTIHRKIAALARYAPVVFWAVAPGVRRTFDVEIDPTGMPRLRTRDALPRGPLAELDCRICGSEEDVRGHSLPGGRIGLVCTSCDHHWSRTPRTACRRCGSADVEVGAYQGWAYDEPEAAADDTMASWHYVDWDVYRCQKCHHVWQVGRRAD